VELETVDNMYAQNKLQESAWAAYLLPTTNAIKLQMNKTAIPELTHYLINNGVGILSIQPRHSLEDYFLSLTTEQHHVDTVKN
jgi:hypothetical protein